MTWKINYLAQMGKLVAMHKTINKKLNIAKKKNQILATTAGILTFLAIGGVLSVTHGISVFNMKAIGVLLISFITGFTFYQLTIGPKMEYETLIVLYKKMGIKLAIIRNNPDKFNWNEYKNLELSYVNANLNIPSDKDIGREKYRLWNEFIKHPIKE